MDLQNIGDGNSDDVFNRYKMPKMVTKIEGKGNCIKTNVVNMVGIAKSLATPASYITRFFGCELGVQSKFDHKNNVSLVHGAHETAKLIGLLENFIKKFVQCYKCDNPKTEIIITETQIVQIKCAACGFVFDVDKRDKLTTFILKNPPDQIKGSMDNYSTDENNDDENEKAKGSPHEKLVEYIRKNLKMRSTVIHVQSFLSCLNATRGEVMNALFDVLFQGVTEGFAKEVDKKKNYLAAAVQTEESQLLLLRTLDNFCRKSKPDAVKEVALVLKALYDADVLDEEYIVRWYEEGLAGTNKNSEIWKNTMPFIEWLQSVESESE